MLKRRLIPVLYLLNGWMVRSELFRTHQVLGQVVHHIERMMDWEVDELIVLNIGREERYEAGRTDVRYPGAFDFASLISQISGQCRIPLTFGGQIRTFGDVAMRIENGADKIALNTVLHEDPAMVTRAAHAYGSQAIVASIDYRLVDGQPVTFIEGGTKSVALSPVESARRAVELGAGEILLNAIDRDGVACGFDIARIAELVDSVDIPVIACGGAGRDIHFVRTFEATTVPAIAAGNIFHFTEDAYPRIKRLLRTRFGDFR
ncbi:HisA/HisF-related TIM barrel protein [Methylobacterium sp. PvR107]|uniref:HisA/HisF-related TIM barrel protein n=1 Tax=Methylobacterium sp. PvR107 TaxID=2806597 RepID=UPI001AE216F1|nr:HisA/HisF-related TIM barrel protein [Methylobacterium sp. PvR107]MBP1178519.1 cyclase [Methylobacterium sp. PvR107]